MSEIKFKFVVVGYDASERQTFWDVIPVAGDLENAEDAETVARARFLELRGGYAEIVDAMTCAHFLSMALRIDGRPDQEDEAAYAAMECEAREEDEIEEGITLEAERLSGSEVTR